MWLFTNFGSFSVVQKDTDDSLTVRSRARGDLDRLRCAYLSELGPSEANLGSSYPWRAAVSRAGFALALPKIVEDLNYCSFDAEVAATLGEGRSHVLGKVWKALETQMDGPSEPEGEEKSSPWSLPSDASVVRYGALIVDVEGQILLRKVPGGHDGYAWTFAKGRARELESPRTTAIRIAHEQTVASARIITSVPGEHAGSGTTSRYFLMVVDRPTVNLQTRNHWTDEVYFAHPEEARSMIGKTKNAAGRKRDLHLVDVVLSMLPANPPLVRPIALRGDWKKRPMPYRRASLDVTGTYSPDQMASIWRGFIPSCMEEKWFAYYEDDILYVHRSWTGLASFRIHFRRHGECWSIERCEACRHPDEQYKEPREAANLAHTVLNILLETPNKRSVDPMVSALTAGMAPGYLGSPHVVEALLSSHLEAYLSAWADEEGQTDETIASDEFLVQIFCGKNPDYVSIGTWHTMEGLGGALCKAFEIEADGDEIDLERVVAKGLDRFVEAVMMRYAGLGDDDKPPKEELSRLVSFTQAAFMGTLDAVMPGVTISDLERP